MKPVWGKSKVVSILLANGWTEVTRFGWQDKHDFPEGGFWAETRGGRIIFGPHSSLLAVQTHGLPDADMSGFNLKIGPVEELKVSKP